LLTDNVLNQSVKNIQVKPEWKKAMSRESFVNGYLN
jgi:hypothetical protein